MNDIKLTKELIKILNSVNGKQSEEQAKQLINQLLNIKS